MYGKIFQHIPHQPTVEDLLQNCLMKIYKNLPLLRSDDAFESWAFQICNNEIRHYFRSNRKHLFYKKNSSFPELFLFLKDKYTLYQASHSNQQPDQIALKKALITLIQTEINLLPSPQHEVLTLWLEGKSMAQIQDHLSLSLPAVKARLRRARLRLKKELVQKHGEEILNDLKT